MYLSIGAAVTTIGLKGLAYLLTGSVGLLSDAMESLVNLVAALLALFLLTIAERPPDDEHAYGHTKAEYFSSAAEGALILLAAYSIASAALQRIANPQPLENVGIGLLVSVVASAINFGVARVLLQAGKRYNSITLEADAHHLMTDVWTSAGVLVGVLLVALTGWLRLDPVIALLVGLNIVRTGWQLISASVSGLLDRSLDADTQQRIDVVLERYAAHEVRFHAVRTREAGHRSFVTLHLLVPGAWSVQRGHDLSEEIEQALCEAVEHCEVAVHIE
ncbi:MAG: cation transporter, partial [Caldilineaceae bacterium]|nr:cation transporter [Caldilineaceae bacterium]